MDREIWCKVLDAIKRAARSVEPTVRCPLFGDWLIVAMYFWTCSHDRPQCWACDREHYGRLFRPRKLPSVSQFNRRVKTASVMRIMQRVHNDLARIGVAVPVSFGFQLGVIAAEAKTVGAVLEKMQFDRHVVLSAGQYEFDPFSSPFPAAGAGGPIILREVLSSVERGAGRVASTEFMLAQAEVPSADRP